MRVTVIFEFDNIDPETDAGYEIAETIHESCETMQTAFDAQACWVHEVTNEGGDPA